MAKTPPDVAHRIAPLPHPRTRAPVARTPAEMRRREVQTLLDRITSEVAHLPDQSVREMLPILAEAEREVARDLARWLSTARDAEERFTAQQYRAVLLQLRKSQELPGRIEGVPDSPVWLKRIRDGLRHDLIESGSRSGLMASQHVAEELARFSAVFGGSLSPIPISTAAIIVRGQRMLAPRYRTSAARYAGGVMDDIKRQLAIGVVRKESIFQLTSRMQRLGGPRGLVATRGVLGDPGAVAEHISEGLFTRYRHWGERVVRTEVINAYNVQAEEGIKQVARESEEPMLKRWDATADGRVCALCHGLHGNTVKPGEVFKGGVTHPPLHPNCRCAVVLWNKDWQW